MLCNWPYLIGCELVEEYKRVGNELVLHSTRNMNRSLAVGVLVSLPVFYALLDGEFLVILVAMIGGYVAYTLLS